MNVTIIYPVILAIIIIVALTIFFHFVPFFLWLSAKVSGVKISLIQLFLSSFSCASATCRPRSSSRA